MDLEVALLHMGQEALVACTVEEALQTDLEVAHSTYPAAAAAAAAAGDSIAADHTPAAGGTAGTASSLAGRRCRDC